MIILYIEVMLEYFLKLGSDSAASFTTSDNTYQLIFIVLMNRRNIKGLSWRQMLLLPHVDSLYRGHALTSRRSLPVYINYTTTLCCEGLRLLFV